MYSLHKPSAQPTKENPTLVMLHGRGSDERDLFSFSRQLNPQLEIFSLRAPFSYRWGGYTWFELFDDGSVDEKSFTESKTALQEFIFTLQSEKIILMGFSMGAIMSYALALTQPKTCNGIACLSGFAPAQLEQDYKLTELQNLDIFVSHGIADPIIPISFARKTKQLLQSSTARVTYNEYPMSHEISEECFADLTQWLHRLL